MLTTIIDSHAHLDWDSFQSDQDVVVQRAMASGVVQIVQAGVHLQQIPELLSIIQQFPCIYTGIGLHPHEAKHWNDASEQVITDALRNSKVVALGECGLDFHYSHSTRDIQLEVFAKQVKLACQAGKPLIVHTRNAWPETIDILHRHGQGKIKGVFHCFTGGPEIVAETKSLDFYYSFSGIVTFPKAHDIHRAVGQVPADRLLVETDSPYLAPQGLRGQRNEPANVWLVADKIAQLRGCSRNEIAELTSNNARQLFNLPNPT